MFTDKQIDAAQDAYRKHVAAYGVDGSREAILAALEAADTVELVPVETAPTDAHQWAKIGRQFPTLPR